jgi:hypothetical protein
MPRTIITHSVKDVKHWASKGDERVKDFAPFATEVVSYVAVDGSNQVAVALNIHDMEAGMAYAQSPEAAAKMEAHGVLPPLVWHFEGSPG